MITLGDFYNNNGTSEDRYRPLFDLARTNCRDDPNEKRQSMDRMMMISYKGQKGGHRKQYVKNKTKKWGYKVFVKAWVSDYISDFLCTSQKHFME